MSCSFFTPNIHNLLNYTPISNFISDFFYVAYYIHCTCMVFILTGYEGDIMCVGSEEKIIPKAEGNMSVWRSNRSCAPHDQVSLILHRGIFKRVQQSNVIIHARCYIIYKILCQWESSLFWIWHKDTLIYKTEQADPWIVCSDPIQLCTPRLKFFCIYL